MAAFVAGISGLATWPGLSAAAVIVSLNNAGSTTLHEVVVEPGDTFNVDINLEADVMVGWVRLAVKASSSGVFDIVEVTDNPPWTSQGTVFSMVGALDPTSGYGAFTYLGSPSPGFTTLGSIQIAVDAGTAIGTYGLDTAEILWTESPAIPESWPGMAGPTFSVHVVPEPDTLLLLLTPVSALTRRIAFSC